MRIYIVKRTIYLLLLCFLTVCCTKSNVSTDLSVIPVASMVGKYELLNISDYASSITYIPLETNDNALVSDVIEQIIYENEQFIVRDPTTNASCMVFDKSGRYLHNLGRKGMGPGEYTSVRHISTWNDSIFLYIPYPAKINIYNKDGQLLDIMNMDSIHATYFIFPVWYLKPHIYLSDVVTMTPPNSIASYPRALLLQEENNRLTVNKEYPYVNYRVEIGGFSTNFEIATMYRFNDQIRTYKAINDTIFTVGPDTEMKTAFVFDFGKYRASTEWMFGRIADKISVYIWPPNIMESSDYLFIEFFFGKHAPESFEYVYRRWSDGSERIWPDHRVFSLF